jgi:hypothetical protein
MATETDPRRAGRRYCALLAFTLLPFAAAVPAAGSPDPCTLVTAKEAAAAMGAPAKAGEAGRFLPTCTYAADLPTADPRAHINQVFIKIEDESQFQMPRTSKSFHTENVSVGDDAYYSWSGQNVVTGMALSFKRGDTYVMIELTAFQGAKNDPASITGDEIKVRELTLARAAVQRIP